MTIKFRRHRQPVPHGGRDTRLPSPAEAKVQRLKRKQKALQTDLKTVDLELIRYETSRRSASVQRSVSHAVASGSIYRDGSPRDDPRHREIRRRYAWVAFAPSKEFSRPTRQTIGRSTLIARVRLHELERLFSRRYGSELPPSDLGRSDAAIAAHHIAHIGPDAVRHIRDWLGLWAPWMSPDAVKSLTEKVLARPRKFTASTLGERLCLFDGERRALGITTIAACDVDPEQRAQRRREVRRLADQKRRRRKGACPRSAYRAAALANTRPWEAFKVSRSTWYRRGRPVPPPYQWED